MEGITDKITEEMIKAAGVWGGGMCKYHYNNMHTLGNKQKGGGETCSWESPQGVHMEAKTSLKFGAVHTL